jgi:branched-subunit amino acid transport protein
MNQLWLLVIAMGLVTYLPRMLPLVLLRQRELTPFLQQFFRLIPYAALGALIFPGILTSTGNTPSAIAGGILATVLAFFRLNVLVVVLGGITGVFLWQSYIH